MRLRTTPRIGGSAPPVRWTSQMPSSPFPPVMRRRRRSRGTSRRRGGTGRLAPRHGAPAVPAPGGPVDDGADLAGPAVRALASATRALAAARAGPAGARAARRLGLDRADAVPHRRPAPARRASSAAPVELSRAQLPHLRSRGRQTGHLVLQPGRVEPRRRRRCAAYVPPPLPARADRRGSGLVPRRDGRPRRLGGALPRRRHARPGRAWNARVLPHGALLPLRRERRAARRDPPRAVAAAGRGGRSRALGNRAGRGRGRAGLPLRPPAGRPDLVARAVLRPTARLDSATRGPARAFKRTSSFPLTLDTSV